MVANLSAHKRGWDSRWQEFSDWAVRGKQCHQALLRLVDEDAAAFNTLLEAFRLSQDGEAEKAARIAAVEAATSRAIEVPLEVMQASLDAMEILEAMSVGGLPTSISDVGVGALLARAAVRGAHLNARINAAGLADDKAGAAYLERATELADAADAFEARILTAVEQRLGKR
jgi:glutamate formiminotransferase/formiminotetrahydrofolate cyclodeaminase